MSTLDHLEIRNFKSIHCLDIELKSLNILIGSNGAGKSNFVGVFKFLNHVIKANLQNYTAASGGADSILYFGRKTSEEMSFKLSFEDWVNGYECSFSPTPEDNFYFSNNEKVWFHDKKYPMPYNESIGSGHLESEIPGSKKRVAHYVSKYLDSWRLYHFHDTSESARVKQTCSIADNKSLQHDARNLAAFLYLLEKKHPDDIVVVDREKEQSVFKRLNRPDDMEDWLEEYGLSDLWEKNVLGGRP